MFDSSRSFQSKSERFKMVQFLPYYHGSLKNKNTTPFLIFRLSSMWKIQSIYSLTPSSRVKIQLSSKNPLCDQTSAITP